MSVISQIVALANQLRSSNPSLYRQKRARPGYPGYVKDGFRNSVQEATQQYYCTVGKTPSQAAIQQREIGSDAHRLKNNPQQDELYRCYKQSLERLKTQYHNAGLTVIRPSKLRILKSRCPLLKKKIATCSVVKI